MRLPTLALLLPVGALAQDEGPAYVADRSLLRPPVVPSEELCPTRSESRKFRVERGEAGGLQAPEAIATARRAALESLEDKVCAGLETSPRCLAARRNIVPLGAGQWERRGARGWACASVAIEEALLNSEQHDLEQLDADLSALAEGLRGRLGGAPFQLLPPTWKSTGCSAGEPGAHLHTLLMGKLAGTLPADATTTAAQVRLELSVAGGQAAVAVSTRDPGAFAWTPLDLPALTFPADLFQLTPADARICPAEAGLPAADQPGAGGLAVQLFAVGQGGLYCEGETVSPRIELSGPARLRLYSIEADGQGYRVWPHRAEDDRVYTPTDPPRLPTFTAMQAPDGGDSRLVVAAFPPDTALDPAAFCRLPAALDAASLPGSPALTSATFHVLPAGERLCLGRGDPSVTGAQRDHAAAALRQAPACPVTR